MQTHLVEKQSEIQEQISRLCPICGQGDVYSLLTAPDRFHGRSQLYTLARCPSCLSTWLQDPPTPEDMGYHYGADYDRAIACAGSDPGHWLERRDVLRRYKSGGALLDLGCSSGGFLASMKSPAWKLFGIEMSSAVARKAEESTGAEVFVGDILDAPFAANSFDAITCFHVFEHLYDPMAVLKRVSEWLKPGGVFYSMVPNIDSAGRRIFGSYWYALELPRHLYHFSPASLRYIAGAVGLQEVSITTHREVFIENSVRYILDAGLAKLGAPRAPLAKARPARLPWKVMRKAFRLTVLPLLSGIASFAGDGESIHSVLSKRPLPETGNLFHSAEGR